MNNTSYVCIPAGKLVEIIEHCCPPNMSVEHCERLAHEDCGGHSCINCWNSWFKDGE